MNGREETRLKNRTNILSLIRNRNGISQIDLARETALQASTVSYAVRELRESGLVRSIGRGDTGPGGGKRSVIVGADPDAGHYAGILLRRSTCDITVTDFAGSLLSIDHYTLPTGNTDEFVARVSQIVYDHSTAVASPLLGIGIAVASIVSNDGTIAASADFPVSITGLDERIVLLLGNQGIRDVPVVLENDANCISLHAHHQQAGAFSHVLSFVFSSEPVTIGTGLVINGEVYRGAAGAAGEILAAEEHANPSRMGKNLDMIVRFTDPDLVVVTHDSGDATWTVVENRMKELRHRRVIRIGNPQAAIAGAILLAYERSVPGLIGASGKGGIS